MNVGIVFDDLDVPVVITGGAAFPAMSGTVVYNYDGIGVVKLPNLVAAIAATDGGDAASVNAAIWRTSQVAATDGADAAAVAGRVTTGASVASVDEIGRAHV